MRIDEVPREFERSFLWLRITCAGLLTGIMMYVVIMVLMANGSPDGPFSVWDYPGQNAGADPDRHSTLVAVLAALAVVDFIGAFIIHARLLRRPVSGRTLRSWSLPDTVAGRAFAQYRYARTMGVAMAESVGLNGLVVFILAGHFATFSIPTLIAAVIGVVSLFPTTANLLEHLNERLDADGLVPGTEGPEQ